MESPSKLDVTMFNATINAYPEKRPKIPDKKYNIKTLFTNCNIQKIESNEKEYVDYINVEKISVCLPGGRGCVGKERMGTILTNRQVAMKDKTGIYKSSLHKNIHNSIEPKEYGFLQLSGYIMYKDGTKGNINIPVDSSGLIGLRTGASKKMKLTDENLMNMIKEIEGLLLKYLNIKKERKTRLEMINANFNIYTSKKKVKQTNIDPRPRILNFKDTLDFLYAHMKDFYNKPTKKWLSSQGRPCVMKGVFKPLNKKEYPTISMSPYGLIEIQGSNSVKNILKAKKIIMESFAKTKQNIRTAKGVDMCNRNVKKQHKYESPSMASVKLDVLINKNGRLLIKGSECMMTSKRNIVEVAKRLGLAERGLKKELCDRIRIATQTKRKSKWEIFTNKLKKSTKKETPKMQKETTNKPPVTPPVVEKQKNVKILKKPVKRKENDVKLKNFDIFDVNGDGDCQYTSVQKAANLEDDIKTMRLKTARYIRNNLQNYSPYLLNEFDENNNVDVNSYINGIINGDWGNEITLEVLSKIYSLDICLYKVDSKIWVRYKNGSKRIYMKHQGSEFTGHYDYMVKKLNEIKKGTQKPSLANMKNGSYNFKELGVPPYMERANAIHKVWKGSFKDALEMAKDPFFAFEPFYQQWNINYQNSSTYPCDHPVYKISDKYGPPANCRKSIVASKEKRKRELKKKQR